MWEKTYWEWTSCTIVPKSCKAWKLKNERKSVSQQRKTANPNHFFSSLEVNSKLKMIVLQHFFLCKKPRLIGWFSYEIYAKVYKTFGSMRMRATLVRREPFCCTHPWKSIQSLKWSSCNTFSYAKNPDWLDGSLMKYMQKCTKHLGPCAWEPLWCAESHFGALRATCAQSHFHSQQKEFLHIFHLISIQSIWVSCIWENDNRQSF